MMAYGLLSLGYIVIYGKDCWLLKEERVFGMSRENVLVHTSSPS